MSCAMDTLVESPEVEQSAAPAARAAAWLDGAALALRLEAIHDEARGLEAARQAILDACRDAYESARGGLKSRFLEGARGLETARHHAGIVDSLVQALFGYALEKLYPNANPSLGERLAVVAVGGYGRAELAPESDLDLLFLLGYRKAPHAEQVVETLLYFLWDLGFKVGHATRDIDECLAGARGDITIGTNLLDHRLVAGDLSLHEEFAERFDAEVRLRNIERFIEAKLAERDQRHTRQGASRYVLEPNVKDGKGGLRDLQTLAWIAKYAYGIKDLAELVGRGVLTASELKSFERAHEFLWALRCHLHYLTGRAEERLTFDVQPDLALQMGYRGRAGSSDVERLMRHYFLTAREVGSLTRTICAAVEAGHGRRSRFRLPLLHGRRRGRKLAGFRLEGDRLTVESGKVFAEKPVEMLRIFRVAQRENLDIHPEALRWIARALPKLGRSVRRDPEANRLFLEMLTSEDDPETTLRRLNEAGVLGRFLPDFGRIVALMQYNMYHHYTVDEHIIRAIGVLAAVETGELSEIAPIATEVVHRLHHRRALYVATLLHDIAKGRPQDHSTEGAKIARELCPQLGLNAEETETVAWLIENHLMMSAVAFKRDLEDPQTVRDFAANVRSLERLRLLLVLTVADIRAVGPGTWTRWKAQLLRDLFRSTEAELSGGHSSETQVATGEGGNVAPSAVEYQRARVTNAKDALAEALAGWPEADLEAHLSRPYPGYWLAFDTATHVRHARLARTAEAEGNALSIETRNDLHLDVTEVTIYAVDHPGLFSRIAGAMAVAGLSIEQAKIFTFTNGMALDTFYVLDATTGGAISGGKRAKLAVIIEQVLAGRLKPMHELAKRASAIPSRLEVFTVDPSVLIDNKASRRYSVIEINGRDRPGLLYRLTFVLTRLNLMVLGAKISTYGERAVDVFYVQDVLGGKVEDPQRLKRIRKRLLEVLDGDKDRPKRSSRAAAAGRRRRSRAARERRKGGRSA